MEMNARYTSFVAVGDSFTEGMSDALPDGSYRGWADLLAARLAAAARPPSGEPAAAPGFRYANLAVRGKLIGQIADEQCGPAAAMGADLVTLVGGLNDVLRHGAVVVDLYGSRASIWFRGQSAGSPAGPRVTAARQSAPNYFRTRTDTRRRRGSGAPGRGLEEPTAGTGALACANRQ